MSQASNVTSGEITQRIERNAPPQTCEEFPFLDCAIKYAIHHANEAATRIAQAGISSLGLRFVTGSTSATRFAQTGPGQRTRHTQLFSTFLRSTDPRGSYGRGWALMTTQTFEASDTHSRCSPHSSGCRHVLPVRMISQNGLIAANLYVLGQTRYFS